MVATSFRFSGVVLCPGVPAFVSNGTKPQRRVFPGFLQTKTGLLNFSRDLGHVGRAPRYNDVFRLRESALDFVQEAPVALPEEIVQKLFLKLGSRRILYQCLYILRVQPLGINEHDPVEEINRGWGELFDIHISPHQPFPAWLELLHLLGDAERGRHALVTDPVREQMPAVRHAFHENDRVGRKRLRKLAVEVRFPDVRHGHQLDGLSVVANVSSHLDRQTARPQRQEALAEMIHGKRGAKAEITNGGRQQHEQVHQQECRQIPPAESPGLKPVPGDQRPTELKPTLHPVKDAQTAEHLAERRDPGDLLTTTVEIDQERYDDELSQRGEQNNRQKQAFGDHGSESHQAVNHQSDESGEKKQNSTNQPQDVDTEKENQGVIDQRNGPIGQE